MKKILVPVDFSEQTENACAYAMQLAKKFNSEIRLFHSYFDQVIVSDSSFPTGVDTDTMLNEQLLRDIEKRAKSDIMELQSNMFDDLKKEGLEHKVKVVYNLEGGEPESEIIEISKKYHPDIIIMGTRGKSNMGILMGSVSKKIMNNAHVPVLAVPQNFRFVELREIMYMTDFKSNDSLVLNKLFSLLKGFSIKVYCVHINLHEKRKEENEDKMNAIKTEFNGRINSGQLSCSLIDSKDTDQCIEDFVKRNSIDLIAFVSHKRNLFQNLFHSSLSKKDLFQAEIPLLAFHEQE
jgi:nucleotide-binding universal stress UspA family protein